MPLARGTKSGSNGDSVVDFHPRNNGVTKGHTGSVQWLRKMKKSFPLTLAGAERVVRCGFIRVPLQDEQIRLETRLVTLASNESRLVANLSAHL